MQSTDRPKVSDAPGSTASSSPRTVTVAPAATDPFYRIPPLEHGWGAFPISTSPAGGDDGPMVDPECLSSAQARAYAGAARLCASQIGLAGQELTCLTEPAHAAEGTEFEGPGAAGLRSQLVSVGGQLQAARGNIGELVSLLNEVAHRYGELAETLQVRERAAEEAARESRRSSLPRLPSSPPRVETGGAFPGIQATPPPLRRGAGR